MAWPVDMARDFLAWQDQYFKKSNWSVDGRYSAYVAYTGIPVMVTVPSLAEHALPRSSTVGHCPPVKRTAAWFILDGDPLAVDWQAGLDAPVKDQLITWEKYKEKFGSKNLA